MNFMTGLTGYRVMAFTLQFAPRPEFIVLHKLSNGGLITYSQDKNLCNPISTHWGLSHSEYRQTYVRTYVVNVDQTTTAQCTCTTMHVTKEGEGRQLWRGLCTV